MLTDNTLVSIRLSQDRGTCMDVRPSHPSGRSKRRPNDPMVILFRVRACHMPNKVKPSVLNE